MHLGTTIETALKKVGITPEGVTEWIGIPCGCQERRDKLNQLSLWATRVLKGKTADALRYLNLITTNQE